MPMPLRLEVFETQDVPDGPVILMPEEVEEIRLNAYERGYGAGWDDGGSQADAEEDARRTALARQAEQLNFTYHEMRGHVLSAVKPVLEAMIEQVLPAAVKASVVPLVIEQLLPFAHAAADAPITLRVAPGSGPAFEAAFEGLVLPPLEIVEDEDLAEGQAEFAFGAQETRIDLTLAVDTIRGAVERFYLIQTEESRRA